MIGSRTRDLPAYSVVSAVAQCVVCGCMTARGGTARRVWQRAVARVARLSQNKRPVSLRWRAHSSRSAGLGCSQLYERAALLRQTETERARNPWQRAGSSGPTGNAHHFPPSEDAEWRRAAESACSKKASSGRGRERQGDARAVRRGALSPANGRNSPSVRTHIFTALQQSSAVLH